MPISLTASGVAYTQNFDTLANTGTSSLLPNSFEISEAGTAANATYTAGTGSGNTGDTYSFGAAGSTDRALGGLQSGSLIPTFGVSFTNNTGAMITSLQIAYTGEQYRLGSTGRADRIDFQYSTTATSVASPANNWIDVDSLDFSSRVTTGTVGALDGNAAANRALISSTITGLSIAPGATFFIRWTDLNATGADDALAVDDFSLTPITAAVAQPGTLSIADATVVEGNAGTTPISFIVTRAGGSDGAVSVAYAVTFGAGGADANDFAVGTALTGSVNFANGETSKTITLNVAGDLMVEGDESFTVTLSAPTGGVTITDGIAIGTITNDDVAARPGTLSIADATVLEGNAGSTPISFVVTRADGAAGAVSASFNVSFAPGAGNADAADFAAGTLLSGTVNFADGETSKTITLNVAGDTLVEGDETFTVLLSAPTGGAMIGDGTAIGTITNDDVAPVAPPNVFINEIHYDNSGVDINEAVEIAGTAGTNLTGYRLVFYNGSNTPGAAVVYQTTNLTGVIDDEGQGFGAVFFSYPSNGIQNGASDGIALIAPDGRVLQFLSYEGVITAAAGTPAGGLTSIDIGVSEDGTGSATASLQATGTGSVAADFTFQPDAPSSFGMLNTGQTIIGANGTGLVSIADASVIEGDSGVQQLIFNVRRAGGSGQSASVDFTVALDGTANAADLAPGAVLSGTVTFGVGETVKQIVVPIQGDTLAEGNETLSVTLSNPIGNISVVDGSAIGTITNDDPVALAIYQIQGETHRSTVTGQTVITSGIVTAIDSNGFYLQDAVGDGNSRTSDGIFVFTSTAPTVLVGDGVNVRGRVDEFLPGAGSLTITQIAAPIIQVVSSGNALPAATLIGTGGVLPPNTVFEDDGFTSFDPLTDAADFYESLEGMRVTIDAPLVTSATNGFGETQVVASGGVGATGVNSRGGITIGSDSPDFNPERIQIDDDAGIFAGFRPDFGQGDRLSSVTGIVNYAFNTYEVLVTEAVTVTFDAPAPTREITNLVGTADSLSIATYNLENLDPTDNKFDILARDIVINLRAPDIIGVNEIQDADGAGTGSNLSGFVTAQRLIDAIRTAGGPTYTYIEVAPTAPNTTGGEPNGNIRNGFFFNDDRVDYIANSAVAVPGSAFNGSRSPLAAQFVFNAQTITAISVHSTSRGGSEPLFGANQPPANAGDGARTAQATAIRAFVNNLLAGDPNANIAVLGDFNGFTFENAIGALEAGGALTDLNRRLPNEERYSFVFEGNAQALDHILVTPGLFLNAQYDAVHLNSEQPDTPARGTDHDPQLALLSFARANEAPVNLLLSNATIVENAAAGTVVGTLSATDRVGDVLRYSLVDDAAGRFVVDAVTGIVTAVSSFDFEATPSVAIVGRATDQGGLTVEARFTINVSDVNEAPVAFNDTVNVNEDATTANLAALILGNDRDPDAGDALRITSVDTTSTLGSVIFDAATQSVRYAADNDAFDALATGVTASDSFRYTITDAGGLTSTATVAVTVTGVNDAPVAFNDTVNVNEDATTANLAALILGNDRDPDAGDALRITSVDTGGTLGSLIFNAATQSLQYVADNDAFDALASGATATDSFRYTVTDAGGLTSTATVAVTVTGIADGITRTGTSAADTLTGTTGEDILFGVTGNDTLSGLAGNDQLFGGSGNDILLGGEGRDFLSGGIGNDIIDGGAGDDRLFGEAGNDTLTGGSGRDIFSFARGNGVDTITDFNTMLDRILLESGVDVMRTAVSDVNRDGIADLTLTFSTGNSVALLGVNDFNAIMFDRAPDPVAVGPIA
jgi:uncharacterized protein